MAVVDGRDDDGNAASLNHLIIICIAQCGIHPLVIGSQTDERPLVSLGVLLIDAVEMFLKIKHFCCWVMSDGLDDG